MSATVNKPTDVKKRDEDIGRKLQLYGIISAFQAGKVPSNAQIDVALNSFLESKALASPSEKLSDEGKALVADTKEVVKQAKYLLLSKNEGNLLQDFIWQTQQWDPKTVTTPDTPVDRQTAQQHGKDALEGLRTLGTLLITNGQFRKLLNDASVLLRDMAGDAATNAAGKVRPSEDQLAQMDRPADDHTWHEAPKLDKESMRQRVRGVYGGSPKDDVKDIAATGQNAAGADANARPSDVDPNAGKAATAEAVKNKANEKITEEDRAKLRARRDEYRAKAKEYFNKKMPQERKDQIIFRLKKMVLECQQHPDYTQAIQTLLDLTEQYGSHGRLYAQGGSDAAQQARSGLAKAEYDLKTIIERFANGTSTDPLWSAIGKIYEDADKDSELKDWFKAMNAYIRRCLLEQGYILDDRSSEEWDHLYEHGRYLLREKYKAHTDRVVDEIRFIGEQFDQDPQNHAFARSLQKLFTDLGNDESGRMVFKPHLLKDLRDVIIPGVLENVAYIPIPRIEYQDPQVDCIIENLVLESDNFAPNVLEIASEHYFRWGRKMAADSKSHQRVEIKVSGVQMDVRDVSYHIKKKQGFPSVTDTGIMDIVLPGSGFSFKLKMSTADEKDSGHNFFKIDKVDVDFKSLKINVKKSKYKLIFGLFQPIATAILRKPVEKAVERALKDQAARLDAAMFQIKQEANRAKDEILEEGAKNPNSYQQYYTAVQNRILQSKEKAKEKAKEKVEDKKVNIAMTKEDSIFPHINLPGGTSTKATEYRELARKGDKWESPVFSIGKAAQSTDIPPAPEVVKKTIPPRKTADRNGDAGRGATDAFYTNGNGPKYTALPPGATNTTIPTTMY